MVLLNSAKRARMASSTVNQPQGGGETKAGLPYIVGRMAASSRPMRLSSGGCDVPHMAMTYAFAAQSRPIGVTGVIPRLSGP